MTALKLVIFDVDGTLVDSQGSMETVQRGRVVEGYKEAFHAARVAGGVAEAPLYPGIREMLEALSADPEVLLGVATGKSRRGLDALIEGHELGQFFVTQQCADDHPSKPHPSMVMTALLETGVEAADAVMVGDTSFDMEMAAVAGVAGLGVSWGYHKPDALRMARRVVDTAHDLPPAIAGFWEKTA